MRTSSVPTEPISRYSSVGTWCRNALDCGAVGSTGTALSSRTAIPTSTSRAGESTRIRPHLDSRHCQQPRPSVPRSRQARRGGADIPASTSWEGESAATQKHNHPKFCLVESLRTMKLDEMDNLERIDLTVTPRKQWTQESDHSPGDSGSTLLRP